METKVQVVECKMRVKIKKDKHMTVYPFCGEGGIRTRGTELPVRQFSKLLISATHPPHRPKFLGWQK